MGKKVTKYEIADEPLPVVSEPGAFYFQKAEEDLLRAALRRSYTERFLVMTSLMKDSLMMKRAKITYKPYRK